MFDEDNIPWLQKENVEDQSGAGLTGLPEMVSSGQTVGSVISSTLASRVAEQVLNTYLTLCILFVIDLVSF